MKRGKLMLLLVFILLLPLVSATISIEGPSRDEYNIGDTIDISGYVWESKAVYGFLSTKIVCEKKEFPLQLVPLDLAAEQQILFPEDIELPKITIPAHMLGNCEVKLSVMEGLNEIDSAESRTFKIVKDLEGTFDMEETKIQVGSDIILDAKVFQKDNDLVTGIAEVFFEYNDTRYLIEVLDVMDSEFTFIYKTKATPAGMYNIDISVRDTYGNEQLFDNVATFLLIRQLTVSADVDKMEYMPGDTVKLLGDVTNIVLDKINNADAEITINGQDFVTVVEEGIFSHSFTLPEDTRSGKHLVSVLVRDEYGNSGSAQVEMNVGSVASRIENSLGSQELVPKDMFEVVIGLLDQADDELDDDVLVEITDPKGDLRLSKFTQSNQKVIFKIPDFASPGTWKLKSSKDELVDEDEFTVLRVTDLSVEREGEVLYVKNTGNVEYKEGIEIVLMSGTDEFRIKNRKNIDPNETLIINLKDEVPSGNYDVSIPMPNTEAKSLENVVVEGGKPVKSFNGIYLLLLVILVILIIYVSLVQSKKPKYRPPKKKKKLVNVKRKAEERKEAEEVKKRDIRDFKDRILEEIKKTEAKAEDVLKSKRGGMFGNSEPEKKEEKKDENQGGFASLFG